MDFSGWTPLDVAGHMRTADLRPMGWGRARGIHLSDCIRAAKIAASENVGEVPGDQPGVRMQEGFLWETALEYLLAGAPFDDAVELAFKRYCLAQRGHVVKQIALERDGVLMTPDGLDPRVPQLESYKSTRRSLRNARTAEDFEAHFWTWVMQEAAYCYAAGLDQVRWIVWWQAGDYSRGKGTGPVVLEATAKFTREELERNWRGVVAIAERLKKEREEGGEAA